jgi:hypothetical protein
MNQDKPKYLYVVGIILFGVLVYLKYYYGIHLPF